MTVRPMRVAVPPGPWRLVVCAALVFLLALILSLLYWMTLSLVISSTTSYANEVDRSYAHHFAQYLPDPFLLPLHILALTVLVVHAAKRLGLALWLACSRPPLARSDPRIKKLGERIGESFILLLVAPAVASLGPHGHFYLIGVFWPLVIGGVLLLFVLRTRYERTYPTFARPMAADGDPFPNFPA